MKMNETKFDGEGELSLGKKAIELSDKTNLTWIQIAEKLDISLPVLSNCLDAVNEELVEKLERFSKRS